jgi:hypothetical protein
LRPAIDNSAIYFAAMSTSTGQSRIRSPISWIAVAVLICMLSFAAWRLTSGVSGEAFVVNDGKVVSVPGARIYLKQISPEEQRQLVSRRFDLSRDFHTQASDAIRQINKETSVDDYIALSDYQNNLSEQHFSSGLFDLVSSIRNPGAFITGNSDREGHFSFHVPPGLYVIVLGGQAGKDYVTWFETFKVSWRTKIQLVDPDSTYVQ